MFFTTVNRLIYLLFTYFYVMFKLKNYYKTICILLFCVFGLNVSNAQNRKGLYGHELPGTFSLAISTVGPSYLFGDVGGAVNEQILGATDWNIKDTRYLFSIGAQHIFPNNFGVKANLFVGNFSGTDASTSNSVRGYTFNSQVYEASLQGQYVFFGGEYSKFKTPHTLYLLAGVGYLMSTSANTYLGVPISGFNPARPDDVLASQVFTATLPLGIGYTFKLTKRISLGTEFGYHYIFSDLVDGLSTPSSRSNDVLCDLNFVFSYKIYGGRPNADKCNCLWY